MKSVAEAPKAMQIKPKVMIADDDPPTRILLRAAVSQWGYEVIEAKDGEEAWMILQEPNSPRILVLDWLMPKMDGIELCARIKEFTKQRPYIILLTQVTGTTNIVKGLEAGADEFLSKPFNMAELRSRLSVGAKIIGYENSSSEYHAQLTQLKEDLTLLSKYIDNLCQSKVVNNELMNHADLNQQVKQIYDHLKSLQSQLERYQSKS